jgi:hypothetical protein
MLRPAICRQTNAELYSLTTVTHEFIRFGTLTGCSLGPS